MVIYPTGYDSLPHGYKLANSNNYYDGSIDLINGRSPVPGWTATTDLVTIEGWLAFSAKEGIAFDEVFSTLKNQGGIIKYFGTHRKARPDVNNSFNQPSMADVGFKATIDVKNLKGDYLLGLALGYKRKLILCERFNLPVKILIK